MSRLRKNPATEARTAFQTEIRVRRAEIGLPQKSLAEALGIAPSSVSALLANPDKISVGRLREIVHTLNPDPQIILALVGYEPKKGENHE